MPLTRARAGIEAGFGRMARPAIRPGSKSAAGFPRACDRSTERGLLRPKSLRVRIFPTKGVLDEGAALPDLPGDLVDEVVKPPLSERVGRLAFLLRNGVRPSKPVEHEVRDGLDAEINGPGEPSQAPLEPVHALHQPVLKRAASVGIEITSQRRFEDVGLGRLLLVRCGFESSEERSVEAEVDAGFHRAAAQCVGTDAAECIFDARFEGVTARAPAMSVSVPPRARPA